MKLIILTVVFFSPFFSFAGGKPSLDDIRKKYRIVEGEYNLLSGSKEECVNGEFKLFPGTGGAISLKAGGGLLAQHIQNEVVNFKQNGCSVNYTNRVTISGFSNVEAVNCVKNKTSYSRTLEIEFRDQKISYSLSLRDILKGTESTTKCVLELETSK